LTLLPYTTLFRSPSKAEPVFAMTDSSVRMVGFREPSHFSKGFCFDQPCNRNKVPFLDHVLSVIFGPLQSPGTAPLPTHHYGCGVPHPDDLWRGVDEVLVGLGFRHSHKDFE